MAVSSIYWRIWSIWPLNLGALAETKGLPDMRDIAIRFIAPHVPSPPVAALEPLLNALAIQPPSNFEWVHAAPRSIHAERNS
jgi:hypothetical protein